MQRRALESCQIKHKHAFCVSGFIRFADKTTLSYVYICSCISFCLLRVNNKMLCNPDVLV